MDADSLITTTSTMASGAHSHDPRQKKPKKKVLSIDKTSKIDREFNKKVKYRHRPSASAVVLKWMSTIILGLLLLCFVTWSKISTISISERMANADPEKAAQLFVFLQLIAVIPHVLSFIRAVFAASFRPDIPWPRKKSLGVGVIVSVLESFGLALFIFKIAAVASPGTSVLLMSCVFIVPAIDNTYCIFRGRQGGTQRVKGRVTATFVVALLLELAGLAITGYEIYSDGSRVKVENAWIFPVAVLCLSIAWTPRVQVYLLEYDDDVEEEEDIEDETDFINETMATGTQSTQASAGNSSGYQGYNNTQSQSIHTSIQLTGIPQVPPSEQKPTAARSAWKLTIWMSAWKVVFTTGFSFLLFFVIPPKVELLENESYWDGWKGLHKLDELWYMLGNIFGSIAGYMVGYISCTACMQRFGFSVPLALLSTPLSFIVMTVDKTCTEFVDSEDLPDNCPEIKPWLVVALVCLVLAQTMSTGWVLFKSQSIVMMKEDQLFWTPMYNSVLLEQWLMLVRKTEMHDDDYEDPLEKVKRSKIIICTTMYREADYEMRQLLESIRSIDMAQSAGQRHFEAHVFFDGAVKDRNPTDFVLQLVHLVESVLGTKAEHSSKVSTPYGMSLTWDLKGDGEHRGMIFKIHLKDNIKVKNKKRWSQVMYMSYVLDFLMEQEKDANDEDWFILTTDADVKFTPDSVEALLDLMTRDPSVGAVCARTHPLGSGPLIWYQVFEYAIGHWFQKAAEHVIGSVLCSPGCFSVYRCKAIKDILPQYASNVEAAFEFLTKDMGEDRWFCTLLVQSGWRIEYCAASENSTHCPTDFDEFFKQRRRWVASTLANLMLLVREWNIISKLNHRVSVIFLIYQAILLFATLIGPSSIILVVTGGIRYALPAIGATAAVIVQIFVCIGYTAVCLLTSSKTQLNIGKLLTFLYAVIMAVVMVGTAVQIASDFNGDNQGAGNFISDSIKLSTTTVYLGTMVSIFLVTGILHLGEILFLLYGLWFFLCMPAGYLILMVYSICNITDRSWGTREVKTHSVRVERQRWQDTFIDTFKSIFFCCFKKAPETKSIEIQTDVSTGKRTSRTTSVSETTDNAGFDTDIHGTLNKQFTDFRSTSIDGTFTSIPEMQEQEHATGANFMMTRVTTDDEDDDDDMDENIVIPVEEWLPKDMASLANTFEQHGFENTMFISKMTEKELKDLGVKGRGKKQNLMEHIKQLPDYEIQAQVPKNVDDWLESIGLPQYKSNFKKEQIKTSKDMEVLKSFGRLEIEKELKIKKIGHIKRLLYAIGKLRNPTAIERQILEVKQSLTLPKLHQLRKVNVEENEFWETLKNKCLLPQSTAYGLEEDLKGKLGDLRTQWLMVFAVSNTLWMVLIYTLAEQGKLLSVFGSNPVGLVVLVLFSFVLIIQFFAMLVHRVTTLTHFLGRAPYKLTDTFNTAWAFSDNDMKAKSDHQPEDVEAIMARSITRRMAHGRIRGRNRLRRTRSNREDTTPLIYAREEEEG